MNPFSSQVFGVVIGQQDVIGQQHRKKQLYRSNYVVVCCHAYEKSFNHVMLERVFDTLNNQGHSTQLIDLYAEGFNPVYDKDELRFFLTNGTHDPLVRKNLELVRATDGIVFVAPVWWNSVPGMLKGFIDKVMKEGDGLSLPPAFMVNWTTYDIRMSSRHPRRPPSICGCCR